MSIGPLYVIVIYYIHIFYIRKFRNQQDVLKNHYLIQTEGMWMKQTNIPLMNFTQG